MAFIILKPAPSIGFQLEIGFYSEGKRRRRDVDLFYSV